MKDGVLTARIPAVKAAVQFDSRLSNALVSPPENIWLSPLQTPPEELPRITDCITHHFDEKLGVRSHLPIHWKPATGTDRVPPQPLSVGFSSPHLTVAGLGSVSLTLHDPPARLLLLSLVATIVQRFKIIYDNGQVVEPREARYVLPKVNVQQRPAPTPPSRGESPAPRGRDPGRRSEPPSPLDSPRLAAFTRSPPTSRSASPLQRRHPVEPELYTPDPVPLAQVEAGQQYHHSRICRIPDANHVRPSTLTGSKTKIGAFELLHVRIPVERKLTCSRSSVVSHRMHVEVRYRPEGAETDLRLVVEQPITISGWSVPRIRPHVSFPSSFESRLTFSLYRVQLVLVRQFSPARVRRSRPGRQSRQRRPGPSVPARALHVLPLSQGPPRL